MFSENWRSVEKKEKELHFYLITVAYDGSNFAGWAKQPRVFTAQGYIENILSKIFSRKINILAASRTDKGVHALNQKFTLRLDFFLASQKLKLILVKSLKEYIIVKNVQQVKANFHPIKSVTKKEYRYYINTGEYNLFAKKYGWEYNLPLDTKKFNSILTVFQGKHDFFNFSYCRQKDRAKTLTVRAIEKIRCWKKKNDGFSRWRTKNSSDLLTISIIARSFLRYQIRAIIGESVECYEAKQTIQQLKRKLIFSEQKSKYKFLAPAGGLYLWKITYN